MDISSQILTDGMMVNQVYKDALQCQTKVDLQVLIVTLSYHHCVKLKMWQVMFKLPFFAQGSISVKIGS